MLSIAESMSEAASTGAPFETGTPNPASNFFAWYSCMFMYGKLSGYKFCISASITDRTGLYLE